MKGRISILWRTSLAVGKTPDPHQKRRLSEIPRMCRKLYVNIGETANNVTKKRNY